MTPDINHVTAALADRYRIERQLGAGGMATVYLAHDLRHDRNVAVKVLKPELAVVLGAARFLTEIRTTATLQHPHILPLHDSGEVDGVVFYVMPYVTGESLRDRLDREKQLPVDDAIRIAREVADALGYAHAQGVIHRDIKPENILLQGNHALVADFGIAVAAVNTGGSRLTETGMSLGTPHYMSPEQAMGDRTLDARTDLYALGCVLYEMLTGEPPFTGPTAQAIVARVITEKPRPVASVRDTVPHHLDLLLQRALAKLPADRPASAQQFAEALNAPAGGAATAGVPMAGAYGAGAYGAGAYASATYAADAYAATAGSRATDARATDLLPQRQRGIALPPRVRAAMPWAIAVAGLALGAWGTSRPEASNDAAPATRFRLQLMPGVTLPPQGANFGIAVPGDGSKVVVLAYRGGTVMLYLRTLSNPEFQELEGTDAPISPFFSPDGNSIGFFSNGWLRKVSLDGGGVTRIAQSVSISGASWGADDTIIYASSDGSGLWQVSAAGGEPRRVTVPDTASGEQAHLVPSFLPDGRAFVFTNYRSRENASLAVGTLDGRVRDLGLVGFRPLYVTSGHLLYNTLAGDVMAVPFDARRREITGSPTLVVGGVRTHTSGVGVWSASANGTIVLDQGSGSSRLVVVDRAGRVEALSDETRDFRLPRIAPDGNRVAVQVTRGNDNDIWILDRRTSALTRFTAGGTYSDAIWTPDGRRIAVASSEAGGDFDIFWRNADGSGQIERIVAGPGQQWPWSWTPDGQTLLFDESIPGIPVRIVATSPGDGSARRVVVESEFSNRMGRLSPDGRWIAYSSIETGRAEVYVRPYDGSGGKQQISLNGGDQPVWSRDGRELFYRDGARMIAVSLVFGDDVTITSRTPLFDDRFTMSNATNYDVTPDGRAFVMLEPLDGDRQLTVMVNWLGVLRGRPAAR